MCVIYVPDTLHRNAIRRDETELNAERVREKTVTMETFSHVCTLAHKITSPFYLLANKSYMTGDLRAPST